MADPQFFINDATFKSPDVPVLLQILNGVPPLQLLPNGSIYNLEGQKSVEISIPAGPLALGGPVSCANICGVIIGILTVRPIQAPYPPAWAQLPRGPQCWKFDLQL
jgi:hypothetical protein